MVFGFQVRTVYGCMISMLRC